MHIFKEIEALQAHLRTLRSTHSTVGFVPTMGALHEGHLSLVRASRQQHPVTVCSIYVNPTQFGNPEDLEKYPRTMEADLLLLEKENCSVVFCPDNEVMYGSVAPISIAFPGLDDVLEGAFRPGHFSGVAQVVAKLFHIVGPDQAFFGEKDYQQVLVVRRLVEALKFNVRILSMPTVREADGLAMSSRNQRLSPDERERATVLFSSLTFAREAILNGQRLTAIVEEVTAKCTAKGVSLEYLALADRDTFDSLNLVTDPRRAIILIAARVGAIRLIDNLLVQS